MMKMIFAGLWASIVALGSAYGAMMWKQSQTVGATEQVADKIESMKLPIISVPVIADNGLKGYALAQFSVQVRETPLKKMPYAVEPLFIDEAFRIIYASESIDFGLIKKKNLAELSKLITDGINKRTGVDLVADVLIDQLNYVSKEEVRQREAR